MMKKILLALGICCALTGQASADYQGIKKVTEFVGFEFICLDSAGIDAKPDSVWVLTYLDAGAALQFSTRNTTYPFSAIGVDTTKDFGDTLYWFSDQIQDIDGSPTPPTYTLAIDVVAWTSKIATHNRHTIQVIADSLNEFAREATVKALHDTLRYLGHNGTGIFLDSAAGNTNTVVGVDGTEKNPVSTFVAARTLADALGAETYYLMNQSTFNDAANDLSASHENWRFFGEGHNLEMAFGSQNVTGSYFNNITLSGAMHASGGDVLYEHCEFGFISANFNGTAINCVLEDTIVMKSARDIQLLGCYSGVTGNHTPTINLSAGSSLLDIRHYSGGLRIMNGASNDTVSMEHDGQIIISANNTSLNVTVRGMATITDSGVTTALTKDAVFSRREADQWVWSNADTTLLDSSLLAEWFIANLPDSALFHNRMQRALYGLDTFGTIGSSVYPNTSDSIFGTGDTLSAADSLGLWLYMMLQSWLTLTEAADTGQHHVWLDTNNTGSQGEREQVLIAGSGDGVVLRAGEYDKVGDSAAFKTWNFTYPATPTAGTMEDSLVTAAEVEVAVWDADTTDHNTGGTEGSANALYQYSTKEAQASESKDSVNDMMRNNSELFSYDVGANLIRNPGFERDSAVANTAPTFWTKGIGTHTDAISVTSTHEGKWAYQLDVAAPDSEIVYQLVGVETLPSGRYYLGAAVNNNVTAPSSNNAYLVIDNAVPTMISGYIDSVLIQPTVTGEIGKVITLPGTDQFIYVGMQLDGDAIDTSRVQFDNIKLIYISPLSDSSSGGGGGLDTLSDAFLTKLIDSIDLELSLVHGAGSWLSGALTGGGLTGLALGAVDTSGTDSLVSNVFIDFYSIAGTYLGTEKTNSAGYIALSMDSGTYLVKSSKRLAQGHIWPLHAGGFDTVHFVANGDTIPSALNSAGVTDSAVTGYDFDAGTPSGANTCVVTVWIGNITGATGRPINDIEVTFKMPGKPIDTCASPVSIMGVVAFTDKTDFNGMAQIEVRRSSCLQGKQYIMTIDSEPWSGKEWKITVPDEDTYTIQESDLD